ncbi:hypothetical protein JHK82_053869 [Glycine max]|uniref:Uncharacterized protein n=2 Tax=Glycine subgen. Soja TaxID=1462606 RepID=K7MYS4_SOYBN|nr:hypothetical protein JHK86_053718 [Glycine max]RZB48331.1 Tryptophan decarboxylase 2 [Glycine soja]KAG4928183.1 hypothetical protein JHK85_054669 [Glycine max]KAG5083704.1 hypothetical protein JHK84_053742 [Glycine max]KAG5086472.1 hypothetical protein JHK82_053869 [Glycine max]
MKNCDKLCNNNVLFSLFSAVDKLNSEDHGNKLNRNVFMTNTVLSGEYILRFAVGAPLTAKRHVNMAWQILQDKATALFESL